MTAPFTDPERPVEQSPKSGCGLRKNLLLWDEECACDLSLGLPNCTVGFVGVIRVRSLIPIPRSQSFGLKLSNDVGQSRDQSAKLFAVRLSLLHCQSCISHGHSPVM